MTPAFAFFTFLNAWWLMLFIAIPFSTQYEPHDNALSYSAAPSKIRWKRACIIATLLAILVTLGLALLLKSGIVPLRNG